MAPFFNTPMMVKFPGQEIIKYVPIAESGSCIHVQHDTTINKFMHTHHTIPAQWLKIATVLFCLSLMGQVHAGKIINSYVNYEDGHYLLNLDMLVDASLNNVYKVLMDADHLIHVNETIKESRLIESKKLQQRVYLETEACIWFFCRRIKQIQRVTEMGSGYIMSVTEPEQSDLEYGKVLWRLQTQDQLTRINYSADFVPDFWVPPLIGPWLLRNRLLEEGKKTIYGIEKQAKLL